MLLTNHSIFLQHLQPWTCAAQKCTQNTFNSVEGHDYQDQRLNNPWDSLECVFNQFNLLDYKGFFLFCIWFIFRVKLQYCNSYYNVNIRKLLAAKVSQGEVEIAKGTSLILSVSHQFDPRFVQTTRESVMWLERTKSFHFTLLRTFIMSHVLSVWINNKCANWIIIIVIRV